MIARHNPKIEFAVIQGIRDFNTWYYMEKRISAEELWTALKFGYIVLRSQVRNVGLAEQLKPEMVRLWHNTGRSNEVIPDWWLWYIGKNKDYDIVEYDTGDPLELAEKIYLAGQKNVPEKKVTKLYNIAMSWAVGDFDFEDREGLIKLAQFIGMLSWSGYKFDESFEALKREVKDYVEKKCADDNELRYMVLGDRKVVSAFDRLFKNKPWTWLTWSDNVR